MNDEYVPRTVRAEVCISASLTRCPFLNAVAHRASPAVARDVALNWHTPSASAPAPSPQSPQSSSSMSQCPVGKRHGVEAGCGPIFEEDTLSSFLGSFSAVHGSGGLVPLDRHARKDRYLRDSGSISYQASAPTARKGLEVGKDQAQLLEQARGTESALMATAMASMSLSGGLGRLPDVILNAIKNRRRHQGKPKPRGSKGSKASGAGNALETTSSPSSSSSSSSPTASPSEGSNQPKRFRNMRHSLGQCPPAIVAMRAAVANLKPIRQLRPYALPVRAVALAGVTVSSNVPMGMLRSKTRKFSLEWVVVVHAIIPFIAALRKACLMPIWGLGLTVAGSVAGQYFGEVLERKRVKGELQLDKAIRRLHPDRLVQYLLP